MSSRSTDSLCGPVLAQLEPAGLYYSYTADDSKYPGRVEFVPHDHVPMR